MALDEIGTLFRRIGIGGESSRTLREAKDLADAAVGDASKSRDFIELALLFLGATLQQRNYIFERWSEAGSPPLAGYAPYASYVLSVEVFFQIALSAGLISRARPSNRVDIAYLFYLPFCMVFISSDNLHKRSAPLFLRANQEFVWGPDLKSDLARLNEYYSQLPDETREKGVLSFDSNPPTEGDFLVARLWDKYLRPWREGQLKVPKMNSEAQTKFVEELNQLTDASELPPEEVDFNVRDPDALAVKRRVRKRKGSWWQVPKDLKTDKDQQ